MICNKYDEAAVYGVKRAHMQRQSRDIKSNLANSTAKKGRKRGEDASWILALVFLIQPRPSIIRGRRANSKLHRTKPFGVTDYSGWEAERIRAGLFRHWID